MSPYDWFNAAQAIILTIAAALLWLVLQAFRSGQWSTALALRVDAAEKRLDRAGKQTSDLASELQALVERMRKEFLSAERAEDLIRESRVDRERLWAEITQLREDVGRRRPPR